VKNIGYPTPTSDITPLALGLFTVTIMKLLSKPDMGLVATHVQIVIFIVEGSLVIRICFLASSLLGR
jgi:hypothetical protein